jgi:hypothetical protein
VLYCRDTVFSLECGHYTLMESEIQFLCFHRSSCRNCKNNMVITGGEKKEQNKLVVEVKVHKESNIAFLLLQDDIPSGTLENCPQCPDC